MQRVVAAFDLSTVARRVVERARLLAERHDASLTLVHVFEPARRAFLDDDQIRILDRFRTEAAERIFSWVRDRTVVPVSLVMPKGAPSRAIARAARDADLLVVGSSSVTVEELGPITRQLAHLARVPLIAVRRHPRVDYRRVVAAVDLSEASRHAVELAFSVAPEATVTAVYGLPTRFDLVLAEAGVPHEELAMLRKQRLERAKVALDEFIAPWEGSVKALVVDGPPQEAVQEAVRRRSADLVIVSSRGGGDNSMVLLGSVAEGIISSVPCDAAVARVPGSFRRP